jgi:hypothetical protein
MRRALAIFTAAWLCGVAPPVQPAGGTATDPQTIDLPLTIEKLWYRTAGKRRQGFLTISQDGLEFTARKRAFLIPLDRIQFISYGPMKGDVDTAWVLLTVGVTPPYDLVGFRDGKKWGYGGRTDEIHARVRGALRQLGAAQYRVPPGLQVYEDPDQGCALTFDDDWNVYLESLVVLSSRSPWGTTILSEQPIRRVEKTAGGEVKNVDDLELLDNILAGESPAFFIERGRVGRGMRCEGFTKNGREQVLSKAREDIVFGEHYEVLEPPSASAQVVGGCDALRVVGRSRRADGEEVVLELYAAAHGDTLFVFGLRALADRYQDYREPFADAVSTVKFPRRPTPLD